MVNGGARFVELSHEGAVALVRIDRPRANALSLAVLGEIEEVFSGLGGAGGAVVLWGGERIFSAGADIDELAVPGRGGEVADGFRRANRAIAACPRPVVAAIAGYALGGGLELALACDLRFAAATARLGQPEILLGVIPGGGGTQRLARLVGPSRAKDLIFTGRQVDAAEAERIGLLDRVVDPGALLPEALAYAAALAAGPRGALGRAKVAIEAAGDLGLEEGLDLERRLFVESLADPDAERGITSFRAEGPGKARFAGD